MKESRGFSVVELVIALGIVALIVSISMVLYSNYQRSASTVDALGTLRVLEEQFSLLTSENSTALTACDNSLVGAGELDNPYMSITISPIALDETDLTKGYGAGVVINSVVDQFGPTGIAATRLLHEELVGQNRRVSAATLSDSVVGYSLLLTPSDRDICSAPVAVAAQIVAAPGPTTSAVQLVIPPVSPARITFSFTTEQDVIEFDNTGTGSVMNTGPLQTGGDMAEFAAEFNLMGGQQVATSGIHGATFFSYATASSPDELYAWNPSDLTFRIGGKEYPTGIDTTVDQQSHRYSFLWSSAAGRLQVLVDGVVQFDQTGIATGQQIKGGGVVALAQDQDQFRLEDGSGLSHGFQPKDAFHGQIFSAAFANRVVDAAAIKDAPLANIMDKTNGLMMNMQMSGSGAVDLTGNHQLKLVGGTSTRTVAVDTSIAIPNPGARLRLNISVTPETGDTLTGLRLVGLLAGTLVTDSSGAAGAGADIDILGWDLSGITAQLPQGVAENMNIGVKATTRGQSGDTTDSTEYRSLVLDSSKAVPAAP